MEVHQPVLDHPKKRRRRRRVERIPLSANLIPDANLEGEEAVLSADLNEQLFSWLVAEDNSPLEPQLRYIAVSTWVPNASEVYRELSWTILPLRLKHVQEKYDEAFPLRTIRYPASSSALQSAFGISPSGAASRERIVATKKLRLLVLDIQPVELTCIYVTVDGDALARHEQMQKEFGGGFGPFRKDSYSDRVKGKGKAKAPGQSQVIGEMEYSTKQQQNKELRGAIRSALGSLSIVHQGDHIQLPLPAHPITHASLPPARIILCEPVKYGLLALNTKIVLDRQFGASKRSLRKTNGELHKPLYPALMENGNDTSNEQFFSAVEDGVGGDPSQDEHESAPDSSSPNLDSDNESDESSDGIISLSTPGLLNRAPSLLSSVVATPRARGSGMNGTSTPGSVFSSFTTATARLSSGTGKTYHTNSLIAHIPDDLLHPKPDSGEDDEIRVFIDVKNLTRLKCFSGDWVKLRASSRHGDDHSKSGNINLLQPQYDRDDDYRIAKIYGLPDITQRPLMRSSKQNLSFSNRRFSVDASSHFEHPMSQAWLSPILLSNLDRPAEILISPLTPTNPTKPSFSPMQGSMKLEASRHPPVAAEVSLAKVSTPVSQETALQDILFLTLKQYFEAKRRIVKTGDLIALTIDVSVGRILRPSNAAAENDRDMEELTSLLAKSYQPGTPSLEVIWFRVGQISRSSSSGPDAGENGENVWGGAACVDPALTRMTIGASYQSQIPSDLQIPWKSYLGVVSKMPAESYASPLTRYMLTRPRAYTSALSRRLRGLIAAATSPRAIHLGIQPTSILLYSTQRNIGKARVASQAASDLGLHTFSIDSYEVISEGNAGEVQESSINTRISRGLSCGAQYTSILIRHLEALTGDRLIAALQEAVKKVRVLIATTTQLDQVSENLRGIFTHEIEMSAPNESEREGILRNIISEQGLRIARDVDLGAIAVKTAALVAGNLVDIVERADIARQIRLENFVQSVLTAQNQRQILVRDLVVSGGEWARSVIKSDFDIAVDAARKNFADAIGAPKIPNVSWDDVGGLEHVKDAVMETIQLPLERPELFAKGMKKRSGILFYGPPGTGKTLLAKAIATEFSLNFFSVKGPELLNMYIGESEANVRRVFQRARDARPCVVFFDELDSVAPKRGNQGDSGGVMDRIVSQLLAELDGMSNDGRGHNKDEGNAGGGGVFIIGATNRPDLLDQALLRPGRFDKMLYLGISDTHQKQLTILEALTRKFSLHPGLSLARVAESLPFTYTGADLYALCSDAMLKAITRQAEAVDAKIKALPNGPVSHAYFFDHSAKEEDVSVVVTEEDFYTAKTELVGSVSAQELEHYQRVRRSFETPSKPLPPSSAPVPTRPQPTRRTNTAIRTQPLMASQGKDKGKGKGKASLLRSSSSEEEENEHGEEEDDDDDEAYVTSNDSLHASPERGGRDEGGAREKNRGKSKQKATMIPQPKYSFGDAGADADEEMYR